MAEVQDWAAKSGPMSLLGGVRGEAPALPGVHAIGLATVIPCPGSCDGLRCRMRIDREVTLRPLDRDLENA